MAGIKATGLFLLGTLAGFGVALFLFVAHLLDPKRPLLYLSSANAFLAGVWLITGGVLGSVAVARGGKSLRLRTTLGAIAILAVLLAVTVGVRRRAQEFWGLALRHRTQATALSVLGQRDRFDPRVTKEQRTARSRLTHWHRAMSQRFSRAAYIPWLPVPPLVPCNCQACAAPRVGPQSPDE